MVDWEWEEGREYRCEGGVGRRDPRQSSVSQDCVSAWRVLLLVTRGGARVPTYSPARPNCRFNAIAPTIMRKALNRTLDRIYSDDSDSPSAPPRSSRPSIATLDLLIAHSSGDIRSALMSLQFLASEGGGGGGGHLTSLGTGAKGRGGALKGKKGKKRKRGEAMSSDEEEGSRGGKAVGKLKNGKDRVRQLWVRFSVRTEDALCSQSCAVERAVGGVSRAPGS